MKSKDLNSYLFNLAEDLLENNVSLDYKMKGVSMYPTLKAGDTAQVQKCSPEDLKIGDIVIFKSYDLLVGHRLIKISIQNGKKIFITKGDKCSKIDLPFTSDELLGKLTSFYRKNKLINVDTPGMKIRCFLALHASRLVLPLYNFRLSINNKFRLLISEFQSLKKNLSIVTEHSRKEVTVNVIISSLQGILPFIIILCIKLLIDHLTQPSALLVNQHIYIISLLILTALVFLFNGVLSELKGYSTIH